MLREHGFPRLFEKFETKNKNERKIARPPLKVYVEVVAVTRRRGEKNKRKK
jgi:hypothetical protein